MPFLRFSRDKRGYEHTYLVETFNRRGKPARTRILYWYRSPPGVKVGRSPFDPDVQRAIEARNPKIKFDWPAIITTPMPPPEPEPWWERRRAERQARQARRSDDREVEGSEGAAAPDVDERGPEAAAEAAEAVRAGQAMNAHEVAFVSSDVTLHPSEATLDPHAASPDPDAAPVPDLHDTPVTSPQAQTTAEQPAVPGSATGRRRRRRGGRRRRGRRPDAIPGQDSAAAQVADTGGPEGEHGDDGENQGSEFTDDSTEPPSSSSES